ncbi:MAG: chemotaxis protein MotB [Oceanospirillaceae bacterium]|nr:chemotaxis protein MotB [Oceanospirillaceae bacterium]|tara:strand:- start:4912 stop:5673 length:762 start_codon:yes stop_codon:yes gene_type:complete
MRGVSRSKNRTVDEENPYWVSFSDLMSALLVVFILAAVALIIELTQKQDQFTQDIQKLKNAEQARRDILHEIRDELAKQNVIVLIADNDTVLRIPESTLSFDSDKDELPNDPAVVESVRIIGEVLHKAINQPFDHSGSELKRFEYLDTVFIEGHTDSLRSYRRKGNWGLSTFRAISLWEFWNESIDVYPQMGELRNGYGKVLFSVSGYAATRRVNVDEITPEDRRSNRRIDIRFTVKRPELADFEAVSERASQ